MTSEVNPGQKTRALLAPRDSDARKKVPAGLAASRCWYDPRPMFSPVHSVSSAADEQPVPGQAGDHPADHDDQAEPAVSGDERAALRVDDLGLAVGHFL
jgi:hypothetical protein